MTIEIQCHLVQEDFNSNGSFIFECWYLKYSQILAVQMKFCISINQSDVVNVSISWHQNQTKLYHSSQWIQNAE